MSVILFINISFYAIVHWGKMDEIVRQKLSEYLSESLNAKVKIGFLDFNDKQLNISNISILENNDFYKLDIKQIYIEMSLIKLLYSGFKNFKAIEHIRIYEPTLEININNADFSAKKKSRKFIIPDIKQYFQNLNIYDSKISLLFETKYIHFSETFRDINLEIINRKKTNLKLSAINNKSGKISANAIIDDGVISNAIFDWEHYSPDSLNFSFFKSFHSELNLNITVHNNIISYSGNLSNTNFKVYKYLSIIPKAKFSGNFNKFEMKAENASFNRNLVNGGFIVNNPFKKDNQIIGDFYSDNVELSGFYDRLSGISIAKAKVRGRLFDPKITGEVFCEKFSIEGQEIKDSKVEASLSWRDVKLKISQAFWEDQKLFGDGIVNFDGTLNFDVFSNNLKWKRKDLNIQGNLVSNVNFDKKIKIDIKLNDTVIKSNSFFLDDISTEASLEDFDYSVKMTRFRKDASLHLNGNFQNKELHSQIKLKRFNLGDFFQSYSLPLLSGKIDFSSNLDSLKTDASLRLFDKAFGKLDGRFGINLRVNKVKDCSSFKLESYNAKLNYEEFKILLLANGSADSLHSNAFKINDNILLDGWIKFKQKFDFGIIAKGKSVKIKDYFKYFTNYNTSKYVKGFSDFIIEYDSRDDGNVAGIFKINKFSYKNLSDLNIGIQFYGSNNFLHIREFTIAKNENKFLNVESDITLKPQLDIKAIGNIIDLDLEKIISNDEYNGILNGNFTFTHKNNENFADLELKSGKCDLAGFKLDTASLICSQKDRKLDIIDLRIDKENSFSFQSSGSIGYNLFNSNSFPDSNVVNIKFNGDLVEILSEQIEFLSNGRSNCKLDLSVGIQENGLFFRNGNFTINEAEFLLNNQVEKVDKINVKMSIINDTLKIDWFKLRMGEGRFFLSNKIDNDEKDFKLGMLNLGKFYIHTNDRGLLLNIPGFVAFDSVVKVLIKGRYSDDLLISGPFDDIHVLGDVHFSNGGVIYPPNTDNIINLFGQIGLEKENPDFEDDTNYPFDLDVMLHIDENMRYATYPTNLQIIHGGYLHLLYHDGNFSVPDAIFNCEIGQVDLFGTQLDLDFAKVKINPYVDGFYLNGTFFKKASDGTIITLNVFNEKDSKTGNTTLQFRLASDDPSDGMLDILAKLRYNRSIDEISNQEKKTLLQDEMIQIAGLGLETAILDPLIHPLENTIRKLLRLDIFYVQTSIIKNFFDKYYSKEDEEEKNYLQKEELDSVTRFGSDMFLNNLSVSMGKYASRKLFFNYEVQFQKPEEVALGSELGIYHYFTLRYDLPKKYKLAFRYKILPFDNEDSVELAIEKSFRFW